MHDIAREEQVSAAYLYSLLRLPWLAPDISTAIINGRRPPQLTAQTRAPYAVKIRLETVRPHRERFLPYAPEGIVGASGVLVGSRHTAESLWGVVFSDEPSFAGGGRELWLNFFLADVR